MCFLPTERGSESQWALLTSQTSRSELEDLGSQSALLHLNKLNGVERIKM